MLISLLLRGLEATSFKSYKGFDIALHSSGISRALPLPG